VEEAEAPAAEEVVELQAGVVAGAVEVEVVELQAVGVPEGLEEAVAAVVERPPGEGQPAEPSAPVESLCASAA
jgi:hypothetical protein